MKKYIKSTGLIIVTILVLVTACEKEVIMFDSSKNLVGFSNSSMVIKEDLGGPAAAKIYLGAATGTTPATVTLTVDTVGLGASAAKEGIDYTIASKTVSVSVGEVSVNISPVNNTIFTGDKKFYLVISQNDKGYRISAQKKLLITISDDEHPLKTWIGTYTVSAASYGKPGDWDESWTVQTAPVANDVTKLTLTGIGSPSATPITAVLDKTAMTMEMWKYGMVSMIYHLTRMLI
jgi:hypothetical protein